VQRWRRRRMVYFLKKIDDVHHIKQKNIKKRKPSV
jgi:hypothetical protein